MKSRIIVYLWLCQAWILQCIATEVGGIACCNKASELAASTGDRHVDATHIRPSRNVLADTDQDVTRKAAVAAESPSLYKFADSYFAICTVVKDQGDAVREFIDYHRWIGVGKIYIYDHNSSEPLLNLLQDYVHAGLVEYTRFSGHHYVGPRRTFRGTGQGYAFRQCLANARRRHRWVAFIDPDEFIVLREQLAEVPPRHPDINAFMRKYEPYAGLGLNWRVFGSSGHVTKPTKGCLSSYHKCMPENAGQNQHIKSVVNMQYVLSIGGNPHAFRYWKNATVVNELFAPISDLPQQCAFSKPASTKRIALYHYVTKSLEEYMKKMKRGGGSGSIKKIDYMQSVDQQSTDDCTDALPLWDLCCANPPPVSGYNSNRIDNALEDVRKLQWSDLSSAKQHS